MLRQDVIAVMRDAAAAGETTARVLAESNDNLRRRLGCAAQEMEALNPGLARGTH